MPLPIRMEVLPGADGPLVRKIAETDLGRVRIAAEAARLERARHPGVVVPVQVDEEALVLAWAGTDTLATTRPPLPVAAGILAAVASTVADLHEVGIVHGRLEPSHVVLDGDGRPRLCSFRGSDPDQVPAAPADDVAALGRLIDHLVGADAELEPIPERRWGRNRWTGYTRRALLTLADQATDGDPARRPTARALAAAIADTVPEAHLAPPTVAAVGPAPGAIVPEPEPEPELEPVEPGLRAIDHDRPGSEEPGLGQERPEEDVIGPVLVEGAARFLGLRIDPGTDVRCDPEAGGAARVRPVPAVPVPAGPPITARRRRPILVVAVALLLLALAGWVWPGARDGSPGPEPRVLAAPATSSAVMTSAAPPASATTVTVAVVPTTSTDRGCPAPSREGLDVDGDGCPEPVSVRGNRITAGAATFEIGAIGDAVAVGDWDCDGVATPGLVRPTSGEVFLFDRWTTGAAVVTVQAWSVVPGARTVEAAPAADPGSCAGALVRLADGSTADLTAGSTS